MTVFSVAGTLPPVTRNERNTLVLLVGVAGGLWGLWKRRKSGVGLGGTDTFVTENPDMGEDPSIIDVTPRRDRRPVASLNVSQKGVELIKRHEGLRLQLYNDAVGHATIGYGHLVHKGPINGSEPAGFKSGITEAEATDLLRNDLAGVTRDLRKWVKVPLNQDEFDALASFTFNLGIGNLSSSTLLRLLNAGTYDDVGAQFLRWDKARNQQGALVPLAGLTKRRTDEAALWNGAAA